MKKTKRIIKSLEKKGRESKSSERAETQDLSFEMDVKTSSKQSIKGETSLG